VSLRIAAALAAVILTTGAAKHGHEPPVVMAPGWGPLEFVAPAPNSYELPSLWRAGDGRLLDELGEPIDIAALLGDKVVLLSFIYTSCSDVNGCPLATHVLAGVQKAVLGDPRLAQRVRLISVSFDRVHDTPRVMADYASKFRAPDADWPFLTTASEQDLEALLNRYDQWTVRDYDADGRYLGTISHVLRVYLIDTERLVRNIYSVSFLHKDTVINDMLSIISNETRTQQ
jgi:cytochrome c peroxidase